MRRRLNEPAPSRRRPPADTASATSILIATPLARDNPPQSGQRHCCQECCRSRVPDDKGRDPHHAAASARCQHISGLREDSLGAPRRSNLSFSVISCGAARLWWLQPHSPLLVSTRAAGHRGRGAAGESSAPAQSPQAATLRIPPGHRFRLRPTRRVRKRLRTRPAKPGKFAARTPRPSRSKAAARRVSEPARGRGSVRRLRAGAVLHGRMRSCCPRQTAGVIRAGRCNRGPQLPQAAQPRAVFRSHVDRVEGRRARRWPRGRHPLKLPRGGCGPAGEGQEHSCGVAPRYPDAARVTWPRV
jgi:hypothetical protein